MRVTDVWMIKYSIIITTRNEPKQVLECMASIYESLDGYDENDYEILVVAPDDETRAACEFLYCRYIKDEGKGKIAALNLGLKEATGEVLVFTDGDCILSGLNHLFAAFDNKRTGLATGRVIPKPFVSKGVPQPDVHEDKWYFFHRFLLQAAHEQRQTRFENKQYFESTAYLMAFRKGLITEFPDDVAEDAWIVKQLKNHTHVYVPQATVAVKGPCNVKDWVSQKTRCILAHERIKGEKMKSFGNEVGNGLYFALAQNYTLQELIWLPQLFLLRLYVWVKAKTTGLLGGRYRDGWKSVKSTTE